MNVFDLMATIALDDSQYRQSLNGAQKQANSFGKSIKNTLTKAAAAGLKAVWSGVKMLGGAIVDLTKQSVESYAEYEQLSGGISKLFGTAGQSLGEYLESSGKSAEEGIEKYKQLQTAEKAVMENAAKAYKTAGMSVNEYMENVTGFSARLISDLGGDTVEAARIADMAMQDIADNANTFGLYSAEELANVYIALSKGSFQVLDNLSLGYSGTKEEMAKLVNESGVLNGEFVATAENVQDIPFDILIQAIHETQVQMGIAGTTSREASYTISGSVTAMKAAWSNLVTGLADDNADMDQIVNNFIETLVGENGEGGVINNILPAVERSIYGITQLISTAVPMLTPLIVDILKEDLPLLIEAGVTLITEGILPGLIAAIPDLLLMIPDLVTSLISSLGAALEESWPDIKAAGIILLSQLANGLAAGISAIDEAMVGIWESIKEKINEYLESAKTWGSDMIANFTEGIKAKVDAAIDSVRGFVQSIKDLLGFSEPKTGPLSDFHTYAPDMMDLFAKGVKDNEHIVIDQIEKTFDFGDIVAGSAHGSDFASSSAGRVINFNPTINITGEIGDAKGKAEELMYEIKAIFDREAAAYA